MAEIELAATQIGTLVNAKTRKQIALLTKGGRSEKEMTDLANRFVLCWNSHDDLLDACENLRGFLLTQHLAEVRAKENYACPKSCATCYLLNQGLAAIAKAQPE